MADAHDRYPDVIAPALRADGTVKRTHQLLIETVDVKTERLIAYLQTHLRTWKHWLRSRLDIRMICTSKTLTGQPGRRVHVWWVPEDCFARLETSTANPSFATFSLAAFQAYIHEEMHLRDGRWLEAMFGVLNGVSYDLLFPTHYDPGRCWIPVGQASCECEHAPPFDRSAECTKNPGSYPPFKKPSYRLLDVIEVQPGRLSHLADEKRRCFVENARGFGIHLVASGTRLAQPRQLVQIWNLPSLESLDEAIKDFAEKDWYRDIFFKDIRAEHQNLLIPEQDPLSRLEKNCWQFLV